MRSALPRLGALLRLLEWSACATSEASDDSRPEHGVISLATGSAAGWVGAGRRDNILRRITMLATTSTAMHKPARTSRTSVVVVISSSSLSVAPELTGASVAFDAIGARDVEPAPKAHQTFDETTSTYYREVLKSRS